MGVYWIRRRLPHSSLQLLVGGVRAPESHADEPEPHGRDDLKPANKESHPRGEKSVYKSIVLLAWSSSARSSHRLCLAKRQTIRIHSVDTTFPTLVAVVPYLTRKLFAGRDPFLLLGIQSVVTIGRS